MCNLPYQKAEGLRPSERFEYYAGCDTDVDDSHKEWREEQKKEPVLPLLATAS